MRSLHLLLILLLALPLSPFTVTVQHSFTSPKATGYIYTPDPAPGLNGQSAPIESAPIKTADLLVLLVDFQDLKHNQTTDQITNQFFGSNNSLATYYDRASYGQFKLTGQVRGWFTAPHNQSYYGADSSVSTDDGAGQGTDTSYLLIAQIFDQEQSALGIIDDHPNIMIVHAGTGQETSAKGGGSTDAVWSCTWTVTDPATGNIVSEASIVPESELAGAAPFGVVVHEFAHQLGLADLYGYDGSPGKWDLMSSGNWLGTPAGSSPAGLSPLELMIFGWLPQQNILETPWNSSRYVMIDPVEQNSPKGIMALVMNYPDGSYYVVGNREKRGLDTGLPDSGIVIYHITDTPRLAAPRTGSESSWKNGDVLDRGQGRMSVLATFINSTVLIGTGDCDQVPTFTVQLMAAPGIPYLVLDGSHIVLDKQGLAPTLILAIGQHSVLYPTIVSNGDQKRQRLLDAQLYAIMTDQFVPIDKFTPGTFAFDLEQSVLIVGEYASEVKITVQSEYGEVKGTGWYETGNKVTISVTPDLATVSNETRARFQQWTPATNPDYTFTYKFQKPDQPTLTFPAGSAPVTITAQWTLEYLTTIQVLDTSGQPYKGPFILQLYRTGGGTYLLNNETAWLRSGTYHVQQATTDQCRVAGNQTMGTPFGVTAPNTTVPIMLQLSPLTINVRSGLGLPATVDLKITGCTSKTVKDATGTIVLTQFPEGNYVAEWITPSSGQQSSPFGEAILIGQEQFSHQGTTSITVTVVTWYDILIVFAALLIIVFGVRAVRKPAKKKRAK